MRMLRLYTYASAGLAAILLLVAGSQAWAKAEDAPDKPKETAPAAPAVQPTESAGTPAPQEPAPAAGQPAPGPDETAPVAKESDKTEPAPLANESSSKVKGISFKPVGGAPKAPAASQKSWKAAMKAKDTAFAVEGTPDADAENPDDDHKIMPTETIRIDVYGEKDLTVPELRVQAGGQVKYFLLGDVQVGGLTAREAANSIRKQLMDGQYLQDPQVIVTVVQYRKRFVYVLGDVNHPGAVPLEGENRYTIPDVIGQAGGLTRVGIKKFDFIRQGKIERLNLDELNKATDRKKQIFVQPNDTIYIRQSIW